MIYSPSMIRRLIIAASILGSVGCITTSFKMGLVKSRAQFELECDPVQVSQLANDTFGARGCGKRATYVIVCSGGAARTDLCNAISDTARVQPSGK